MVLVLAAVPGLVCPPRGRSFLLKRTVRKHKHYMNSIKPWHTEHNVNGALVKNARGETIGHFDDYTDADAAVEAFNSWEGTPAIEKLNENIEELNEEIASLETKAEDLEADNDDLAKQVESLEEKLSLVRDAIQ